MRSRRRDTRQSADARLPAEPLLPLVGGRLSLDFVNTIERQQRSSEVDVLLPGYGNVLGWALSAAILDRSQALPLVQLAKREPLESVAVRKRAIALREAIRGLLQGEPGDHLEALTIEWRVAMLHRLPVLITDRPVVQWIWDPDLALDSLLWPVALDAMDLITADQRLRVKPCASPTCDWLFLDTTKNGSRQFCRPQICGNRVRVQRFRDSRQSGSSEQRPDE